MVKVIASGVRKGNVIEHEDGKLYVVLKSESMHPGKGTPTTTIDMRRISDGVKTVVRYKTTDAMERAFDATKYGRWSEHPILEATIPSLADPSLVEGAKAVQLADLSYRSVTEQRWMSVPDLKL